MLKLTKSPTCFAARSACASEAPEISIERGFRCWAGWENSPCWHQAADVSVNLPEVQVSTPESVA